MKFIDRPFATTLASFALGAVGGGLTVFSISPFAKLMSSLLQIRLVAPVQAVGEYGSLALMLLILANNSVPPFLSFLYPLIIGKVKWTPSLSEGTENFLLVAFSELCGFLIGFFDLGAILMFAWQTGGGGFVNLLLARSYVHGPLELLLVLLCVAEPMRLVRSRRGNMKLVKALMRDLWLLVFCVIGLLITAAVEVYVGI